jgi:DNA-directed RNA polymerase specialized sigma24 family protein
MDRADAITRLPATYAAVIELLDQGASDEVIAERLDLDRAAVAPLVAVAEAKLARLLADGAAGTSGPAAPEDGSDDGH